MLPEGLSFYILVNVSQMATFGQWGLYWTGQGQPCWKEDKDTKERRETVGFVHLARESHSTQRTSKEKLKGQTGGSNLGKIPSSGSLVGFAAFSAVDLQVLCHRRQEVWFPEYPGWMV